VILEGSVDLNRGMVQAAPNEERIIPIRINRNNEFFFLYNYLF